METTLDNETIDFMVRAIIKDSETFGRLCEEGELDGQLGEKYLFHVEKTKGFDTLFSLDVKTMDEEIVDRLVVHRHTKAIPSGCPRPLLEVYRIDRSSWGVKRPRGMATPFSEVSRTSPRATTGADFRAENPMSLVLSI